ncbi:tryptophan synthase subunit alpha [Buchnera aphidicola (Ceratovacuna keduensis)]|uniref:tryptophan synthase subunit alpha n=1 Tax=Buchnera aphidicola TaxID=9 RepID=UPI0031B7F0CE
MKTRYNNLFINLKKNNEKCFIPFIVLGDPNFETSLNIIDNIIKNGADAIEVGIPFSDPFGDGPIIQNANLRAINSKITVSKCFKILKILRKKYFKIPIGLLTYANIVFCNGIKNFYKKCYEVGLDSILIVDVPVEESSVFYKHSLKNKVSQIFLCPPNVEDYTLNKIIKMSNDYIYIISKPGVTGIFNNKIFNTDTISNRIKKISDIPLIQGFGIYSKNQIKNILKSKIDGVICGSIIVNQIEKYLHNKNKIIKKINNLIKKFKESTKI